MVVVHDSAEWVRIEEVRHVIDALGSRQAVRRLAADRMAFVLFVARHPATTVMELADEFRISRGKRPTHRHTNVMTLLRPLLDAGVLEARRLPRFVKKVGKIVGNDGGGHTDYLFVCEAFLRDGWPADMRAFPWNWSERAGRIHRRGRRKMTRRLLRRWQRRRDEEGAREWLAGLKQAKPERDEKKVLA